MSTKVYERASGGSLSVGSLADGRLVQWRGAITGLVGRDADMVNLLEMTDVGTSWRAGDVAGVTAYLRAELLKPVTSEKRVRLLTDEIEVNDALIKKTDASSSLSPRLAGLNDRGIINYSRQPTQNEKQTVSFNSTTALGGTFTLSWKSYWNNDGWTVHTTAPISVAASAADFKAALMAAFPAMTASTIDVTANLTNPNQPSWTVEFIGTLALKMMVPMTLDETGVTGTPPVTVPPTTNLGTAARSQTASGARLFWPQGTWDFLGSSAPTETTWLTGDAHLAAPVETLATEITINKVGLNLQPDDKIQIIDPQMRVNGPDEFGVDVPGILSLYAGQRLGLPGQSIRIRYATEVGGTTVVQLKGYTRWPYSTNAVVRRYVESKGMHFENLTLKRQNAQFAEHAAFEALSIVCASRFVVRNVVFDGWPNACLTVSHAEWSEEITMTQLNGRNDLTTGAYGFNPSPGIQGGRVAVTADGCRHAMTTNGNKDDVMPSGIVGRFYVKNSTAAGIDVHWASENFQVSGYVEGNNDQDVDADGTPSADDRGQACVKMRGLNHRVGPLIGRDSTVGISNAGQSGLDVTDCHFFNVDYGYFGGATKDMRFHNVHFHANIAGMVVDNTQGSAVADKITGAVGYDKVTRLQLDGVYVHGNPSGYAFDFTATKDGTSTWQSDWDIGKIGARDATRKVRGMGEVSLTPVSGRITVPSGATKVKVAGSAPVNDIAFDDILIGRELLVEFPDGCTSWGGPALLSDDPIVEPRTMVGIESDQLGRAWLERRRLVKPRQPPLWSFYGLTAYRAVGLLQLVEGFDNYVAQLTRSSDSATRDVGLGSDLWIDLADSALTAWRGSDTVYASKLYDQSGNARDRTQATVANMGVLYAAGVLQTVGSDPAVVFDGTTTFYSSSLVAADSLFRTAGAGLFLVAAGVTGAPTTALFSEASSTDADVAFEPVLPVDDGRICNFIRTDDGTVLLNTVGSGSAQTAGIAFDGTQRVVGFSTETQDDGTRLHRLWRNGDTTWDRPYDPTGKVFTADRSTLGRLYRAGSPTHWWAGKLQAELVFNTEVGGSTFAALRDTLRDLAGAP